MGKRGPSILIGSKISLWTLLASRGRGSTDHRGRPYGSKMQSILTSRAYASKSE